MLWFEVKGGTESGRKLMNSIQRPWSLCENLGAVESICTCPSVRVTASPLPSSTTLPLVFFIEEYHLPATSLICPFLVSHLGASVQVMTHANMLQEDRLKVGITDGFVRISCGIEDSSDLLASLKLSLDAL